MNQSSKFLLNSLLLILVILLAFVLRLIGINQYPLWNDEAETAINSLQVLERGYPHGTFRGEPMYENFLWFKAESDKYQYSEVNYQGTIYEKNKGWLPYYYLALVFKFFGQNTLTARLPFVLISILSAVFLYFLAKELCYNKKTAILASLFYSVNYLLIVNERQARYYSFFIFLTIAVLYFYQKLLTAGNKQYYWWLTLGLILLFYTHIIGWLVTIVFIISHWLFIKKKGLSGYWLVSGALIFVFTLPWLLLVKFWTVFQFNTSPELKLIWLLFIATIFGIYWIGKVITEVFFKYQIKFPLPKILLTNLFIIFYLLIIPFLIPEESLAIRIYLPAIALLSITLASQVVGLFNQQRLIKIVPLALLLFILVEAYIYFSQDNGIYYPAWLNPAINYLKEQKVLVNTPVYVGSQQHSFSFYTPYQIQLVWVLRKSYLDSYPGEFYLILNKLRDYCMYKNEKFCEDDFLNYRDRVKSCELKILNNEIYIYHCLPRHSVAGVCLKVE